MVAARSLLATSGVALRTCECPRARPPDSLPWRCLRPERVPVVKVVEVLPAGDHLAVLDLKDDAAIRVEALAVALTAVVMNGHHAAVVTPEHLLQVGLKGAVRLTAIPAELGEDRVAWRRASALYLADRSEVILNEPRSFPIPSPLNI